MVKVIVCKGCGTKMEAVDEQGNPACPICCGISGESGIPAEVELPDIVRCSYCQKEAKTTPDLPFLDRRGTYYCGCRGWD